MFKARFHQNINVLLSPVYANAVCTCIGRGCPRWSESSRGEGLRWPRVIKSNFSRDKADLLPLIPAALLSLQGLAVTFAKQFPFSVSGDARMLPLVKKNGKL